MVRFVFCLVVLLYSLLVSASPRPERVDIMVPDYSPYADREAPHFGLAPQLSTEALRRVGLEANYVFLPVGRFFRNVREGMPMLSWAGSILFEDLQVAEQYLSPMAAILPTHYVLFFDPKRFPQGIDLHQASRYRMEVVVGEPYLHKLTAMSLAPSQSTSLAQSFLRLLKGNRQVDLVGALDLAGITIMRHQGQRLAVSEPLFSMALMLAVPRSHPHASVLQNKLFASFESMFADGTYHQIIQPYYGDYFPTEKLNAFIEEHWTLK